MKNEELKKGSIMPKVHNDNWLIIVISYKYQMVILPINPLSHWWMLMFNHSRSSGKDKKHLATGGGGSCRRGK